MRRRRSEEQSWREKLNQTPRGSFVDGVRLGGQGCKSPNCRCLLLDLDHMQVFVIATGVGRLNLSSI